MFASAEVAGPKRGSRLARGKRPKRPSDMLERNGNSLERNVRVHITFPQKRSVRQILFLGLLQE